MELANDRIAMEFLIAAPPERVFEAIAQDIGKWWSHRFKAEGKVFIEPRIGGRFGESWGEKGGALYATIDYIDPPRRLGMSGPMGINGAVASAMRFDLEPAEGGTRLGLIHDIQGWIEEGTIGSYYMGWKELLGDTLRAYLEKGGRHERIA